MVSCQKSVPESIICFLDSNSFEDCIRNCISLGGDADTMEAIAGGIAEAYYGVPKEIEEYYQKALDRIDELEKNLLYISRKERVFSSIILILLILKREFLKSFQIEFMCLSKEVRCGGLCLLKYIKILIPKNLLSHP